MTAQFLARDTPAWLPWSGEQYATHLASEEFPHCVQLQHAWADCATLIAQPERRSSAEASINAVCGAESVEMLHTAHRLTQKLLSRELADGRFRLLLT